MMTVSEGRKAACLVSLSMSVVYRRRWRVRDCQLFLCSLGVLCQSWSRTPSGERLLMTRRGESSLFLGRMGDDESSLLFSSLVWLPLSFLSLDGFLRAERASLSYRESVSYSPRERSLLCCYEAV